jgi:hypothetical protein
MGNTFRLFSFSQFDLFSGLQAAILKIRLAILERTVVGRIVKFLWWVCLNEATLYIFDLTYFSQRSKFVKKLRSCHVSSFFGLQCSYFV